MKPLRVLHVDLTSGRTAAEDVPAEVAAQFLGSRGVNAYYAYQLIRPGIDPLGPDNVLVFGTGALTGTSAPCSGRTSVTCKSPVTNLYNKTNGGGHWGAELKYAGFDHLIVTGVAPRPVYLWIDDGRAEIRDARGLWGLDTKASNQWLKQAHGDDLQVALIGPAGENLVMCACINFSLHHAAGRAGAGAVMGAKQLKAIAVRGTGAVRVADPAAFYEVSQRTRRELAADNGTITLARWGTSGSIHAGNELSALNTRNFQQNRVDYVHKLSGQYLVEAGYLTGRIACFACSTACHRYVVNQQGPYAGVHGAGPEFEGFVALGSGNDVSDTEAVLLANQRCNLLGMDVISAGAYVQWAMECWEKGLLTAADTDGLDLSWGNGAAVVQAMEKIARREGKLGQLLAQGTKRAAEQLGGDSWKWAVQAKGLEQSGVETRSAKGYALAFAVNPRGPDHLMTETFAELAASPEAVNLIKDITGDAKYATPYLTEKRAEIVRWHEDAYAATDALGFCAFSSTAAYAVNPANMTAMFNASTGSDLTTEALMEAGRRIVTLERCFNVREGARRRDDKLPWRLMNEAVKTGPRAGAINSQAELDGMLDEYYDLHGWDRATSVPTEATLRRLGLYELCSDCLPVAEKV
jgi:aldehyde:ferredoxin oxidoreductase